jgi:hypothetical protein
MTSHATSPGQPAPRRQPAAPRVPAPRPSEEDLLELRDPDELGTRGFGDDRPQYRPKFAFVLDQIRGTGAPPSLAELLENLTAFYAKHPEAEPDLEAEP